MNRNKLYERLTKAIANGLIGFKSVLDHKDPEATYIPPTQNEIERIYRNDSIIHTTIKCMVTHIIHEINSEIDHRHLLPDAADKESWAAFDGEYYIEYVSADVVHLRRCR